MAEIAFRLFMKIINLFHPSLGIQVRVLGRSAQISDLAPAFKRSAVKRPVSQSQEVLSLSHP